MYAWLHVYPLTGTRQVSHATWLIPDSLSRRVKGTSSNLRKHRSGKARSDDEVSFEFVAVFINGGVRSCDTIEATSRRASGPIFSGLTYQSEHGHWHGYWRRYGQAWLYGERK